MDGLFVDRGGHLMRHFNVQVAGSLLFAALSGCGFAPAAPGQVLGEGGSTSTGTGGSPSGKGGSTSSGSGGVNVTGSGGGGGDVVPEIDASTSCGQTNVSVTPEPPDILIVQDKSNSMSQNPAGKACNTAGCSKWSQVSAAIDTVVMATQTTVNWGLVFFGSDNMCGVNATPNVPITPGTSYTPISQAYATNMPSSYTPTEAAVNAAAAYMQTVSDPNPKYLLLATDGLPNCKPNDNTVTDDDSPGAITAVTNAKTAGFPTFVVGIGNTQGTATLNMLATAGGEPQIGSADGNSFYEVNNTAELETALNKIVGLIASCTIPLTGVNGSLEKVAVSAQDSGGNIVQITQDPSNGWSYIDATMKSIVLNGTACADLQNGAYSNFQFIYTCSTGTICIDRKADGTCASSG
jgi:von Willebrand factor type A domain